MTRFKAVKDGTEDDWVFGWFFPRFWMAGNGVEESTFIRDTKGSEFEVDPSTLHQEIGGEWYTMEELREVVKLEKHLTAKELELNTLKAGLVQVELTRDELIAEVERLKENARLRAGVQRLGWINVEDKLPTVLDRVLIWHNTSLNPSWGMYMGKGEEWCLVANNMSVIRNWMEGATNVKVTHWMPLPEKPNP